MTYKEYENRAIQSFEHETTMISDKKIAGSCVLGKATIQMLNDSNKYSDFKNQWIKTVFGSFYVYKVEPVQEKISIKLECYDIKYKLDTPYDSSKHTFPCTLKEWRNSIFTACDVEYDDSDFPNSDLELEEEPYVSSGSTNREVISMIAQAGASAVETINDVFYFIWFSTTSYEVKDWIELTTENKKSSPINRVVLGRGDVEDNVSYPEGEITEPVDFRIDNNYILDPQDTSTENDLRYTTIKPIYEQVNGFSYLIFSMRSQSISNRLSIRLGEIVKFLDIWGNELEGYVMTKKTKWLGGSLDNDNSYEVTLSAEEISESSTETTYSSNLRSEVLSVERKADKAAGQVQDLVKSNEENTERLSKLELNTDSISTSVSNIQTSLTNNYYTKEETTSAVDKEISESETVKQLTEKVTSLTQTAEKVSLEVKNIQENGVDKVTTSTGFTFNEDGLNISKSDSEMNNLVDNLGMYVFKNGSEVFGADNTGVRAENVTIRTYLIRANLTREEVFEDPVFEEGLAEFWIGD